MATTTRLMTVEQFRRLPEDSGETYHELHHGEVVTLTRPKHKHARIQKRLEGLLEIAAGEQGVVSIGVAFRPLPEYELRIADLAYIRVDPDRCRVKVTTHDGRTKTYEAGPQVPISLFGPDARVSVDDIFRY
jgi:Uma2 family endonuclease